MGSHNKNLSHAAHSSGGLVLVYLFEQYFSGNHCFETAKFKVCRIFPGRQVRIRIFPYDGSIALGGDFLFSVFSHFSGELGKESIIHY